MTLTVAVFSFNRGNYLRNCLESIGRNMPFAKVLVFDDGSTEPETLDVLADFAGPVILPETIGKTKHGGLYHNMQMALDHCDTELLCFLQEDMQIVRPVAKEELLEMRKILGATPGRAFLHPVFMKSVRMRRFRRRLDPDPTCRAYVGPKNGAQGWDDRIAYFDVCIADVDRLRTEGWKFVLGEHDNVLQARNMFADMPLLGDPFAFYCPEVPIFRNRRQSLSARLAAHVSGHDVKSFHNLTAEETTRLKARDLSDWPMAEEWLRPVNPKVRRPFVYKDVKTRLWLNVLHRLEQALRR